MSADGIDGPGVVEVAPRDRPPAHLNHVGGKEEAIDLIFWQKISAGVSVQNSLQTVIKQRNLFLQMLCLSLFGDRAESHRLFAMHMTTEYRLKTEGRGRTVDDWKHRPEREDNHWFDGLVGCAVAAYMQGAVLGEHAVKQSKRERIRWSEVQRYKQEQGTRG